MTSSTMVLLDQVRHRYNMEGRSLWAINGVDLAIDSGEFVAIVGPSGSGKSTLLNILGCLDRPSEGRYLLAGTDVSTFSDDQASELRNSKIGFVFQSYQLLPRLTALENVLQPLRFYRGSSPENFRERATHLLTRMGLSDHLGHRPTQLSGGQMQRVAIARALLLRPDLLLADEPTGNLDSASAQDFLDLLKEINEQGQTIILVTHDPYVAATAHRVITLKDGIVDDN